ncbi:hypothetical protein [Sorangium sp. So ce1182]|uniref:hypothetical protein n=1 Tax=Sorangium sp. So ce1182 TaxID=3133334 RepID=UPI003F5D8E96
MKLPILMLLLMAATPAWARAARPASCASGLGQSGYDAGYDGQSKVLAQLWSTHHESCDQFDQFKNQVELTLTKDLPENVFLRCRRAGMIQAFEDAVSRIALACTSTCAFDLEPYTKRSAQMFCGGTTAVAFAQAFLKAGIATPDCGANDWMTCKQKLKTEAEATCRDTVEARRGELDLLADAACRSPE